MLFKGDDPNHYMIAMRIWFQECLQRSLFIVRNRFWEGGGGGVFLRSKDIRSCRQNLSNLF